MGALIEEKPLRVLMTTDTVGGVWSYCMQLCSAMQAFNIHFHLVTTGAPLQAAQREEAALLVNATIHETNFLLEWMESPWASIDAAGNWLLELERKLQPDLIHLNEFAYGALPWKTPVLVVAHSDVWSWWYAVKSEPPPDAWNEYYRRVKKGLQSADCVIAPSQTMLKAVQKIYAVNTPARVIYNGRNAVDFHSVEKESVVFSMGRIWDEAKNIELLIKAAPHIHYPVKLAGDKSFENNNTTTTGTNIAYLGKLSQLQVKTQLAAASLYVLPAKYEPFGLSVLEAALSGCALVLGNIDSLKEIWSDSAVYVDTNDTPALADTINNLMKNDALRMQYAKKASAHALKFSSESMAENYIRAYRKLLDEKKRKQFESTLSNFFKTP